MSKRLSRDFSNNDHKPVANSNLSGHRPTETNGMPPAALQVYQQQEGNQNHQYNNNRNVQYSNVEMDAIDERKNAMMQRASYQHQPSHQHQYNAHPSNGNRMSSSSTRRPRNNSTHSSQNSRDGRPRHHSKDSSRRSMHSSGASSSVANGSARASSQRSSLNNMNVNVNAAHESSNATSSSYHYQQPVHAHSHVHPAPPQSSMNLNNHYTGNNTNSDLKHDPHYPPNPSIQAAQQQQRRPAYLLHRDLVIGKGSYGQVCIASRGEAEGHGRSGGKRKKFACKCVVLRNDPKYIAKLQEEVNVLRELRGHENVIRLYDVFCVDNELFIITELGRGGDLFHLLTTHPKHGVTEAYAGK